jgi:hypothetical protein
MAKDKLNDEEAAKSSLFESSTKRQRTSKAGFGGGGFGDNQSVGSSGNDDDIVNTTDGSHKSLFAPTNENEVDEENDGVDEDTGSPDAVYTKTYALPENAIVVTGEEHEDCLLQVRVKLFRLNFKSKPVTSNPSLANIMTTTRDSDLGMGIYTEQQPSIDTVENEEYSIRDKAIVPSSGNGLQALSVESADMSAAEWVEVGIGPLKLLQSRGPLSTQSNNCTEKDASSSQASRELEGLQFKQMARIVMRREEKKGGIGENTILYLSIILV